MLKLSVVKRIVDLMEKALSNEGHSILKKIKKWNRTVTGAVTETLPNRMSKLITVWLHA